MEEEEKDKWFSIQGIGIIALVLIILILVSNYFFVFYITGKELGSVGEFGDMFGGVNALFSGLAFVGVIIAIMMQSKELELQREELKQTREELKGQKEQLELQNETMQKQQFEHTFFQMLRLHNDHKSDDMVKNIRDFNNYLRSQYGTSCSKGPKKLALDKIQNFFHTRHPLLTYLRMLNALIRFVDNSTMANKIFYLDLLTSEMRQPQLQLVYYYLMTEDGAAMFSTLVENYNLLENLDRENVMSL
ncbi:MAG: putative phage abortive infection protein [Alcanivorax sp.]